MIRGRYKLALPFLTAIIISAALINFSPVLFANIQETYRDQIRKLMNVVHLAQLYYVEEVDWDRAMEGAISGMLETLDPHSVYISEKKAEENKENFSGRYEGIGIQFDIIDKYITVIAPIAGSPSDQLGILAGDRIVKINGKSVIGIGSDEAFDKLKGPKGSTVQISISRSGRDELLDFTITRDVIPIKTVTTNFMSDDSTGYILLNRFSNRTSDEIEEAISELENQKMMRLILDLRRNPGGYLHEAVKVVGKFIPGHQLIVYTKGRSGRIEEEYYSDQFGSRKVRHCPLIILIDQGSASASEIVAGALQDYDRALVIGHTSFGKGLVQKEFDLQDGSAVRITVAKYYTPSGRSIQRDYKGKSIEEYYAEVNESNENQSDTIEVHPVYYTKILGRPVLGGGGINPDMEIEYEGFPKHSNLGSKMLELRFFFQFANEFQLNEMYPKMDLRAFQFSFQITDGILNDFKDFCLRKDFKIDSVDFEKDIDFIKLRLKAEIARKIWGESGFYYVILNSDNQYLAALRSFGEAKKYALLNK